MNNSNFNDAQSQTLNLLEKSMKFRNVADVPISIALSGGIDSSLNFTLYKNSELTRLPQLIFLLNLQKKEMSLQSLENILKKKKLNSSIKY